MRTRRITSAAAAGALALGAMLVAAGPATAEDYYVVDSDLSEGNGWSSVPGGDGTYTSTEDGLVITGDAGVEFDLGPILFDGDRLTAFLESLAVDADGDWQLAVSWAGAYNDGEDMPWGFISPAVDGTVPTGPDGEWILWFGETVYTLEELADLVDGWADFFDEWPGLRSIAIYGDAELNPVTLRSVSFEGDTYYFTPEPQAVDEPEDETGDDAAEGADGEAPPATAVDAEATFTG